MANTKYILEQIRIEGAMEDLISKSDGENTNVTYNGEPMTLAAALTEIFTSITNLPSADGVDEKISAAIDGLIAGAPGTYDTLKEIADYIATDKTATEALEAAIVKKVDKVDGKGLSTEDFTTALKNKLDSMPVITAQDVATWNAKAGTAVATHSANGLMAASDKTRLDALRGVRYGSTVPSDMQDGELFVKIV